MIDEERFFIALAERTDAGDRAADRAPSRVKSRLYSALVAEMAADGSLQPLGVTKACGRNLCVFESLLQLIPDERVTSMNPCRVCHARVLAERFESAPIYWAHCPYVKFQR